MTRRNASRSNDKRSSGPTARAHPASDLLASRGFGERCPSEDAGFARPSAGNNPVIGALSRAPIGVQAKFTIGPVDDPLEREADRVADQVMRMPDPALSFSAAPPQISRKCAACEDEDEKKLQMKSAGGSDLAGAKAPPLVHDALRAPGQPLDHSARDFFEPRLGRDLSHVRVHTDAAAQRSAAAINARAYAVGPHLVFGDNQYAPGATSSRWLIAHELAHALQQREGIVARYAFDANCSSDARTKIATGHRLGAEATRVAGAALQGVAPSGGLKASFDFLFGRDGSAKRDAIASNFLTLHDAMNEAFDYHCPVPGEEPCTGAQAQALDRDNVKVCYDRVKDFTDLGMARVLVHETVRRLYGQRSVTNINDATGECQGPGGSQAQYSEATTDTNHPVPWSCFATQALALRLHDLAARSADVDALYGKVLDGLTALTFWSGTLSWADRPGSGTPVNVSLRATIGDDATVVVFGDYVYDHPTHGRTQGEIVDGYAKLYSGPQGLHTGVAIFFDWREGTAIGGGRWTFNSASDFNGTWGRGDSQSDGGQWTIGRA